MNKDHYRDTQIEYLVQAEQLVTLAKALEARGDIHNAIDTYKKLISTLLNGVQADSDKQRRAAVQQSLPTYITYAEQLSKRTYKAQLESSNTVSKSSTCVTKYNAKELKFYRVMKLFDSSKCMLVQDTRNSKQYAVKIVRKLEESGLFTVVQSALMVRLHFYIEMSDCIYLFVDYIAHENVGTVLRRHGSARHSKPSDLAETRNTKGARPRHPSSQTGKIRRCSSSTDLKVDCTRAEPDADVESKFERSISVRSDPDASQPPQPQPQSQPLRSSSRSGRVPENVYSGRRCAPQALSLAKGDANAHKPLSNVQSSVNMQRVNVQPTPNTDGESHFATLLERVRNEFGLNSLFFQVASPFHIGGEDSAEREPNGEDDSHEMDPLGVAVMGNIRGPSMMQSPSAVSQAEFDFLALGERGNEDLVRLWAAELVLAVDSLHRSGIVLRDLHLENALVRADGHLLLSYFDTSHLVCSSCRRSTAPTVSSSSPSQHLLGTLSMRSSGTSATATQKCVVSRCCCFATAAFSDVALRRGNVAPELLAVAMPANEGDSSTFASPKRHSNTAASQTQPSVLGACDWWSVGSLIFELATGTTVRQANPYGFTLTSQLSIPEYLSLELKSLLRMLLVVAAHQRLGCGALGTDEIQMHAFFTRIDWHRIASFYSPSAVYPSGPKRAEV